MLYCLTAAAVGHYFPPETFVLKKITNESAVHILFCCSSLTVGVFTLQHLCCHFTELLWA